MYDFDLDPYKAIEIENFNAIQNRRRETRREEQARHEAAQ